MTIMNKQWFLIETELDYQEAIDRYEIVKYALEKTKEHQEKML
jgi:HTH-type transcriptional regulator/antitoxin HigA